MTIGSVMIDLEGTELSAKERVLLQHPNLGGILLFSRNFKNIKQLKTLITEIRNTAINTLLIAVDHEGGRVWRFKEGFTVLPEARFYGNLYDQNKTEALQTIKKAGNTMAQELLHVGVDLSFAPVLDIDHGLSTVIGDRAYHQDPNIVSELAKAFVEGMNQAGMQAVGKHFPGHGGCQSDSHYELAIDHRTLQEVMAKDLIPFQKLSQILKGMMPAHVIYPDVDTVPAGYSKRWLQDILRKDLDFQGAIISDCLSMKGAAMGGDFVIRARLAIDAGCDMVILAQQERELLTWVLEKLDRVNTEISVQRLKKLAGNFKQTKTKVNTKSNEIEESIV